MNLSAEMALSGNRRFMMAQSNQMLVNGVMYNNYLSTLILHIR
jgi:hypothetical protein